MTASRLAAGDPGMRGGSAWACALVSGGLWFLADGLHPLWWAAWLAPLPVLLITARPRAAFVLGAAAGLIGASASAPYYDGLGGLGLTAFVLSIQAIITGSAVAFASLAMRRLPAAVAVFTYPAVITGLFHVASLGSANGTAGSPAYSQMDFLPVLQVASLGGTAAVVFVLSLLPSAVALLIRRPPGSRNAAAMALLIVAVCLLWGTKRAMLPNELPKSDSVTVALLATDHFPGITKDLAAVEAAYFPAIDAAIGQGARIIVLPEKLALVLPTQAPALAAALAAKAQTANATLIMGILSAQPDASLRNRALIARPDGAVLAYDKQHLVPGWEHTQTPGTTNRMLPGGIGIAICKDLDFSQLGRDYSRLGAALMLVPAWDFADWWGEDGWSHGRIGVLRGVEGGFAVARAARLGRLTLSDRYGRVLAEAQTHDGMSMLIAQAPLAAHGPTFYARIGDGFGLLCCLYSALVLGLLLWRRPTVKA